MQFPPGYILGMNPKMPRIVLSPQFTEEETILLARVYSGILLWTDKEDADSSISGDDDTGREENSKGSMKDEKENQPTTTEPL
jgi:hypothetical protein